MSDFFIRVAVEALKAMRFGQRLKNKNVNVDCILRIKRRCVFGFAGILQCEQGALALIFIPSRAVLSTSFRRSTDWSTYPTKSFKFVFLIQRAERYTDARINNF
jgi:hypothetical protein